MQVYDKKILYLDYYKGKQKIKNVGFAKIDVRDNDCRVVLTVKGLEVKEPIHAQILLNSIHGEIEIDQISITHGNGTYIGKLNVLNMGNKNITYEQCHGIKLLTGGDTYIYAEWSEPMVTEEKQQVLEVEKIPQQVVEHKEDEIELRQRETKFEVKEKKEKLEDNKWKQLCHNFPKKYPFEDERNYLSITPEDFVILTKKYQVLVNNSFLLHGYYNYKHLLLGKADGEEEKYYLGVPGVFYEREKQVALMFGFESFECEKEPAEIGGFGYYMKRVEI